MNLLLYAAVVLIWGSTWLAIANQVGQVPIAASICYRSAAAAALLFVYLWIRRERLRFGLRDHLSMVLIGALMFSGNYLFLYSAEQRIASGLVAVLFALTLPLNVLNAAIFLRRRVSRRVAISTVVGMVGIVVMFSADLATVRASAETLIGAALALGGTTCFSLGNIVSQHSQEKGVPVVSSEAFGLAYGAVLLVPITLATGGFDFSVSPRYIASLAYLVVFGSIIGFAFYLTMVGSTGAARAGYITVLFPVVGLIWSTLLEGFQWTVSALVGAALILVGSGLAVSPGGASTGGGRHRLAPRHAAGPGRPPTTPIPRQSVGAHDQNDETHHYAVVG